MISVTVLFGLSFLGWSQLFLGRDLPQICQKGDKFEAYQPRRETVFWCFKAEVEATWGMLMSSFTELLMLISSLQCTFLLTWTVLPQMSWEWSPQAPPLFCGTRWAWDPWGPLQTLREILWLLLYQPITNSIVITLFKRQKNFFEISLKSNTCGWRRIYLSIDLKSYQNLGKYILGLLKLTRAEQWFKEKFWKLLWPN